MKKCYTISVLFLSLSILGACSSSGGDDDSPTPQPTSGGDDDPVVIPNPSAATLIFPADDTECNEGELVSETESTVTFRWNESRNTDSYLVTVNNLNTNESFNTVTNDNETPITILRGTPYEWFVTSRANRTNETAQSTLFRFYNEGPGIENYAPFPAEAINPRRGTTIGSTTNSLLLEWSASDVDADIAEYEILFGLQGASTSQGKTTGNTFEVFVTTGNIYEWSVITIDSQANTSTSETFLFRVD